MRVLVHHGGQQWGPFTSDELRRALAERRFDPGDLAWHEGLPAWVPLSSILSAEAIVGVPGNTVAPTSGLAVASLILGAGSTFFCILTGIPAIICGHLARNEIRRAGGRLGGDGMAVAGLVLGYLSLVVLLPLIMAMLLFFGSVGVSIISHANPVIHVQAPAPQYPVNAALQVFRACKAFAADHGGRFPETLEELVPFYLADHQLLVSPLTPEQEIGYFYYGGVENETPTEPLLVSKGGDEFGRQIVIRKDGSLNLRPAKTPPRIIAHAGLGTSGAKVQRGSAR